MCEWIFIYGWTRLSCLFEWGWEWSDHERTLVPLSIWDIMECRGLDVVLFCIIPCCLTDWRLFKVVAVILKLVKIGIRLLGLWCLILCSNISTWDCMGERPDLISIIHKSLRLESNFIRGRLVIFSIPLPTSSRLPLLICFIEKWWIILTFYFTLLTCLRLIPILSYFLSSLACIILIEILMLLLFWSFLLYITHIGNLLMLGVDMGASFLSGGGWLSRRRTFLSITLLSSHLNLLFNLIPTLIWNIISWYLACIHGELSNLINLFWLCWIPTIFLQETLSDWPLLLIQNGHLRFSFNTDLSTKCW